MVEQLPSHSSEEVLCCIHKLCLKNGSWLKGDVLQGVVDVELLHVLDVLEAGVECSNLGGDERIYR